MPSFSVIVNIAAFIVLFFFYDYNCDMIIDIVQLVIFSVFLTEMRQRCWAPQMYIFK